MKNQKNSNSTLSLRPYQREDIEFLKKHDCAGCFNQQRTGKTPVALRTFYEQGITRFVIVCPKTALYPWKTECKKWTNLPATIVTGTPGKKQTLIESWENGALIISYGSIKETQTSTGLINTLLLKMPEGLILDEAHRIKQRTTANAKAAFKLAQFIPKRIALTGTPAPNKPDEIWSILHFLFPKIFKSYWAFVNEYCIVTNQYNSQGRTFKNVGALKPNMIPVLQAFLNEHCTQRKRKDVMAWLPDKEYARIKLPPTKEQTKYLNELKDYFETENIVTEGVLDRLIRYRQICLHPGLIGLKGKSPKMEWVKDYLADYPEKPTILFSKFTNFIHLLDKDLKNIPHACIIGATSAKERANAITNFQEGKINLLLLNIDAGKEAITLDRAEVAIFTDKFPPVGDIEQAEDRFVATTENKAHKAHIIYELVIEGTYDEQVYELIEKRAASVDAINNFKSYMKGEKA